MKPVCCVSCCICPYDDLIHRDLGSQDKLRISYEAWKSVGRETNPALNYKDSLLVRLNTVDTRALATGKKYLKTEIHKILQKISAYRRAHTNPVANIEIWLGCFAVPSCSLSRLCCFASAIRMWLQMWLQMWLRTLGGG